MKPLWIFCDGIDETTPLRMMKSSWQMKKPIITYKDTEVIKYSQ